MKRQINAVVVIVALMAGGCRMADPVYDYCSPVFSGRSNEEPLCDPLYRNGSIYYGYGNYSGGATTQKTQNPVSMPTPKSERIPPASPVSPVTVDLDSRLAPRPATVTQPAIPTQPTPLTPPAPRFRAPATPTQSPLDSLPPLPGETQQTPTPVDHGVTLESLRELDPSITDVEIVEIRD